MGSGEISSYLIESERKKTKYSISDPVINCSNEEHDSFVEKIYMNPGMLACIVDIPKEKEVYTRFSTKKSPLEFGFCLDGNIETSIEDNNLNRNITRTKGARCFIARTSNCSGVTVKDDSAPFRAVSICFDPMLLRLFLENNLEYVKEEFRPLIEPDNEDFFFKSMRLTPSMQAATVTMLGCKYKDPVRKIYMSSKVSELVSLMLMDIMIKDVNKSKSVLQPGEVDNIIAARNILIDNMDTPPTITELAKKVCLNEFKLKAGFKEVFGTTVFGYLQQQRMEKAKSLMESGEFNVSEAAWNIGYTNVSHFIAAFKKHFGVSPGKFLTNVKQELSECMLSKVR